MGIPKNPIKYSPKLTKTTKNMWEKDNDKVGGLAKQGMARWLDDWCVQLMKEEARLLVRVARMVGRNEKTACPQPV